MTPGDAPARLAAAARALFPPEVAVAALDPRPPQESLLPEEEPAVARAVERRRREFAAGRAAARRAMAELGLGARPVPMGADRAPVWPEGVVGSISHSDAFCLAAVARSDQVLALGVDVEPNLPMEEDLWDSVLTPEELAWLVTRPVSKQGRLARLIFSAKECTYKCQYKITNLLFSYNNISIKIEDEKIFSATFIQNTGYFNANDRLIGGYCKLDFILTTLALPYRTG